jgi:phage repressor protein C with HTH and peptisase S24 domain
MSDPQTLAMHRRLMKILEERGIKAASASRAAGVHHDTIRMMGLGRRQSYDKIVKIAASLGISVEALTGQSALAANDSSHDRKVVELRLQPPRMRDLPRDVPVMGVTFGHEQKGHGFDEYFNMIGSEPIDYVRRPPAIAAKRGVYALTILGTSMEPRFRAGELIYVDPDTPPKIGDDVVVQIRNGEDRVAGSVIKTLIRRTADKLLLEQYSPASTFELMRTRVVAIHRVIPWAELLG